jgi:hypothetical protein
MAQRLKWFAAALIAAAAVPLTWRRKCVTIGTYACLEGRW